MAAKSRVDVLIENGTVVTVDPQRRVIRKGAVAIAKNRIKDVGKASALRKKYEARRTYDATMKLVTPGLINAHIHFYHHMHRGLSPETLAGMPWSDFVHRKVATIVNAEDDKIKAKNQINKNPQGAAPPRRKSFHISLGHRNKSRRRSSTPTTRDSRLRVESKSSCACLSLRQ